MSNVLSATLTKNSLFFILMFTSWNCFAQASYYQTGSSGSVFKHSTPEGVAGLYEIYLNAGLPEGHLSAYRDCRPGDDISGNGNRFDLGCTQYNTAAHPTAPGFVTFEFRRLGPTIGRQSCPAVLNAYAPFDVFDDGAIQCGCSSTEYEARNLPGKTVPEVGCFELLDDTAGENQGCTKNGAGNPCNVATGNKYQSETDFSNGGFSFTRSYNSLNLVDQGLGNGWRHNFQRKLIVNENQIVQVSGAGRGEPWAKEGGAWQGEADTDVAIIELASGFQLTKANGVIENYTATGEIESMVDTNGQQTTYTYNADQTLARVTDHYGHAISFVYSDEKLISVTDALGEVYSYEYAANGNMVAVIYPDTTLGASDNPKRTYHYERSSDYPKHLTGITDENGNRYATWAYDDDGRAILSKHAETTTVDVGQETFVLEHDYQVESE